MLVLLTVTALALQQSVADSSPFRPLPLPGATPIRSAAGAPGPRYWQQRADYTLEATLDTGSNVLRGRGRIYYVNRSPETLSFVWVQLDQNLFAPGSISAVLNQPPLLFAGGVVFDFSGKGFVGGITIDRFAAGGRPLATKVFGTMMRVALPRPLAPDRGITFDVAWHFPIPPYGGGRMGRVGSRFYEIGQWYPRMAVYDDVHGWNTLPFLGAGEFYLEFGDFDVSLTVPAGFLVTATGTLANPSAIRTAQERARLARAFTSPGQVVSVITRPEAVVNATRRVPGTRTWRFTASGVRDFAWAAGAGLRWDASTVNGILVQTFYHPDATPWEDANAMVRFALKHFSGALGEYPWPQVSAVEGLIEGMEYPMVIFCPSLQKREDQYWVLMHELGHQWFPMQVGSDERRYPWMDEGFNTFADYDAAEAFFKGTAYGDTVRRELLSAYAATATPGSEQPMITKPDEVRQLYWTAYQKPALMLSILRDVVGRDEFDAAFREYARRWKGKHPQPADFFRTLSNVTGRDLDWFWRGWIYTTARLDQAVDSVRARDDSTFLYLSNRGQMVLPVTVELRYADGTAETRRLPVEMWNLGNRFTYRMATTKRLAGMVLDPRAIYPDIARDNNTWRR
ncbi:MAG TPA: M1 family metallopeptidase [Gemmatimonadales bacterium]|nr:M1 family metallopeptidase [Gemmatimonadales bacterium]